MSSMNESPPESKEIDAPIVDLKDINVPELPKRSNGKLIEKEDDEIDKIDIKEKKEQKADTPDGSSKENSQEIKLKAKKKKDDNIFLELGQFIEIEAPGNDEINNKVFYIEYLDENIISLINDIDKTSISIELNNGTLSDESISAINIVYFPEDKGYARQNGLLLDSWWTFEFGGEVPIIINGQITNLENDMIELSLYPEKEKIYIDFEYKGLPKDLNIVEIRPFSEPKLKFHWKL